MLDLLEPAYFHIHGLSGLSACALLLVFLQGLLGRVSLRQQRQHGAGVEGNQLV